MTRDVNTSGNPGSEPPLEDVGYGCAVWWWIVATLIIILICWWAFIPLWGGGWFHHRGGPGTNPTPSNVQPNMTSQPSAG